MTTTRSTAVLSEIGRLANAESLGCLFAFTHHTDAYSPQMLLVYDEFAEKVFKGAVPLYQIKIEGQMGKDMVEPYTPEDEPLLLEDLLVFSTPTLLWITPLQQPKVGKLVAVNGHTAEIIMRHVGTVMMRKLEADAIEVIGKLNS